MSIPDEDVWKIYAEVATKYLAAALAATVEAAAIHLYAARSHLDTALEILHDDIDEENRAAAKGSDATK